VANDRVEIYFFNDYCINIVQTIFFSLGAEFVCYERERDHTGRYSATRGTKNVRHAGSIGTLGDTARLGYKDRK